MSEKKSKRTTSLEEKVLVISEGKEIYVPRSEAVTKGLTRVIVAGVITDDGHRIFLQCRKKKGDPHDGWYTTSFAGHVSEADKDVPGWDRYISAAMREQEEELGISVALRYCVFKDFEGLQNKFYYEGQWSSSNGILHPNGEECDRRKSHFYDVSRIADMMAFVNADGRPLYNFTPGIVFYLKNRMPEIFGDIEGLSLSE